MMVLSSATTGCLLSRAFLTSAEKEIITEKKKAQPPD
jgi:hypothetical protein